MTLSEGQFLTWNFDSRGHISTFRAKNKSESEAFKAKNDTQTTSEQLQTNFEKVQKMIFSTLKMVENSQNYHVTEAKMSVKNRYFGHQKIFLGRYQTQVWAFWVQNNAITILKQLPNCFEKVKNVPKNKPHPSKNTPHPPILRLNKKPCGFSRCRAIAGSQRRGNERKRFFWPSKWS